MGWVLMGAACACAPLERRRLASLSLDPSPSLSPLRAVDGRPLDEELRQDDGAPAEVEQQPRGRGHGQVFLCVCVSGTCLGEEDVSRTRRRRTTGCGCSAAQRSANGTTARTEAVLPNRETAVCDGLMGRACTAEAEQDVCTFHYHTT